MAFKELIYYNIKESIPPSLLLYLRRRFVSLKLPRHGNLWPIDPDSAVPPDDWKGWPDGRSFALVLTHDVESSRGVDRCLRLAAIEERLGFRSSFNFVAADYDLPDSLRNELTSRGFEVGIHGLHHKGNPFRSRRFFENQAVQINRSLKNWNSVGFRSPSMFHDLDLIRLLDIEYDASTFDTDPFEPQPTGQQTVFPFWVPSSGGRNGYVELPYTLPQDYLLYALLQEKTIDIWKRKLGWLAEHGGMVLTNTHPDYMSFGVPRRPDEYPVEWYEEFLTHIKERFAGQYLHVLPREIARFWKAKYPERAAPVRKPLSVCMPVYTFYEMDNRVMRYAEALARRGDNVTILALGRKGRARRQKVRGVQLHRIQNRDVREKGKVAYVLNFGTFLMKSMIFLAKLNARSRFDLVHVHSVPDFEVFAAAVPKMRGAKVILDIHDIVPEFYASKFGVSKMNPIYRLLAHLEKVSCRYSDHVIVSNHIWQKTLLSRSVKKEKCSVFLNYPDETIFFPRPRKRNDGKFILIYPGTLAWHQGLDLAVKAFSKIAASFPKVEFHIHGKGPEENNLARLIQELGLQDRVVLKETLPIWDIAAVMAEADIGVIPKRNDTFGGDAFSTKILEFMSLGIPVVVAATRVDRFYFNDSVVRFFKPEDVDDLTAQMRSLIEDRAARELQARNALAFVSDFRWDKNKSLYFDLVDGLVLGRGPSGKGCGRQPPIG
jgi:glycosyltransferase involved in cell wall biosynthesis